MSVTLSFRFLSLDKLQALTLERELMACSLSENKNDDSQYKIGNVKGKTFCVSCPLDEHSLGDILNFYIRQELKAKACDIVLSLDQSVDSNPIAVPRLVNDLLKQVDCELKVVTR